MPGRGDRAARAVAYVTCGNCHASQKVRPTDHSYGCRSCQSVYEAIRCGKCHRPYLTDSPAWSTARCSSCGFVEKVNRATTATFDEIDGLLTTEPRPTPKQATASHGEPQHQTLGQYLAERGGFLARVDRRIWPVGVSFVVIVTGLLYCLQWPSVVRGIHSAWVWPGDLWGSYLASSEMVHGHLRLIYSFGFLEFPGLLVALAPFSALSGVLHTSYVQILTANGQVPLYPQTHVGGGLFGRPTFLTYSGTYAAHPQWVILVMPYALALSCTALFAFDALAERLQIGRSRRAALCVVEAVLLWNMVVVWGHPEDALAVALATYALIFALDKRFVGSGWLFGAAVAFQPLVLVMLPVILAVAGRQRFPGLFVRSVAPAAVLVLPPLVANFHKTVHSLVYQPNYPGFDHATPWTAIAPRLGGHGKTLIVAGGPGRLVAIAIAVGIGIWVARRWREHPELVVFACAVALALRSYTESVMDDYYAWGALAVGVVVAGCCTRWRFGSALVVAVATTVFGQLPLAWLPWWTIQIGGLTALLVIVATPEPLVVAKRGETGLGRTATVPKGPSKTAKRRAAPSVV